MSNLLCQNNLESVLFVQLVLEVQELQMTCKISRTSALEMDNLHIGRQNLALPKSK